MNFSQKLNKVIKKNNSLLCIGLDPDLEKIPRHILSGDDPIFAFNKAIIDSTADLVCAYKPNIAFYEAYGIEGLKSLKRTVNYIKSNYSYIPIILDAKRADIGNTARMYAKAMFSHWKADAITIFPTLGLDSLKPFLEYKDKLIILLIKTSNPDSKMFQNLHVGNVPYYLKIAKIISKWKYENIGIFVGATYPKELKNIRNLFPNAVILTAGIGAQSAMIEDAVKSGVDPNGNNLICNNSREIIYSGDSQDFAKIASQKAREIKNLINRYR